MQCLLNVYDRAKERTSMSRTCNENIQYPRKVGQLEHAQTVCTRLFSEKEAGNEANHPRDHVCTAGLEPLQSNHWSKILTNILLLAL